MSYYDEEFYYEPSLFEQQILEFKDSLLKSVKQEYIDEMEKLRKENLELQEVKEKFDDIKRDYKQKQNELEITKQNLKYEIRRERLSSLMKNMEVFMYKATTKYVKLPKCNKCNDNRKIHFKSPKGTDFAEDCECAKNLSVYVPEEFICSEFRINNDNNKMLMWYKINPERDYDYGSYSSSTLAEAVYEEGMNYENLKSYHTFFKSKEDCQKYCDWLNKNKQDEI